MARYVMFGRYTPQAMAQMSPQRTEAARQLIADHGGTIEAMYALLGETDLVFVVDLPDAETAVKVSVGLSKLTGIGFSTCPAVPVERFDELTGET